MIYCSSGETRKGQYVETCSHLQHRHFLVAHGLLEKLREGGERREKKVFIVAPHYDAAASAPCVTPSVSLINEPLAPMSPYHRDNSDQYTMKTSSRGPRARPRRFVRDTG